MVDRVVSKSISESVLVKTIRLHKRSASPACCTSETPPTCCASANELTTCCEDRDDDEEDDEPKRLVVYFNFEKVLKHGRISDKSGYENSGSMAPGGEILKFNDKDYTCNQAARLWDHDIILRGDTFQAKPKTAITIAAWVKMEEHAGQHSLFDTVGSTHAQGQFHFEVNDGVVRWFHRDENQRVVFETMAHTVPKGKWVHLAGTYDSKTKQAKVFINGDIRNQSLGEGILSRDWGVRAGIGNKEKNRPLRGSIDEFRIYNYALKPDEIKALVSACKAVPDAPAPPPVQGGTGSNNIGGGNADATVKSEDAPSPTDPQDGKSVISTGDDAGGGGAPLDAGGAGVGDGNVNAGEGEKPNSKKKRSIDFDYYSYYDNMQ